MFPNSPATRFKDLFWITCIVFKFSELTAKYRTHFEKLADLALSSTFPHGIRQTELSRSHLIKTGRTVLPTCPGSHPAPLIHYLSGHCWPFEFDISTLSLSL